MVQVCDKAFFGEKVASAMCYGVKRFEAGDAPPVAATEGTLYTLSPMTLLVLGAAPSEIGNVLLDFLEVQAVSSLRKVNYRKFAIKVDVSSSAGTCSAKLHLIRRRDGTCRLEFQRRAGDCVCLAHLYQQAARYMQLRGLVVSNVPSIDQDSFSLLRNEKQWLPTTRWSPRGLAMSDLPVSLGGCTPAVA
mmetsp:Transcript_76840/g.238000  ORF Transcript_76840/g.238000 Transcript_76840/m.238000 type:complete len:190 (-) Transcript_76840:87-656(-)